jgi:hypothetical protein
MTWITTLVAPDLTHLFIPVVSSYVMNVALAGNGGSNDPQVRSYIHSYILATDKALRAYNAGRRLLLEYASSQNRTTLLFEGLAELETCITTVKRCLRLITRMGAHRENPDIARQQRRLIETYDAEITALRDAIEHVDGDIFAGGGAGVPGVLHISRDGTLLQVSRHQLTFQRLAECLGELHNVSMAVASRSR